MIRPMLAETTDRWSDPSTWPWFFFVWFTFLLAGGIFFAGWVKRFWLSLQQQKVQASPIAQGQLVGSRSPSVGTESNPWLGKVPLWIKALVWPFVLLSAVGLGVSLWIHLGAVFGKKVAPAHFFLLLHLGCLVVWLPAVLVASSRVRNSYEKNYWDRVFRGSSAWVKYTVYAFAGYAVVNFLLFFAQAFLDQVSDRPIIIGEGTPALVWRGLSGHWMAFYSGALAILYSTIRSPGESRVDPLRK